MPFPEKLSLILPAPPKLEDQIYPYSAFSLIPRITRLRKDLDMMTACDPRRMIRSDDNIGGRVQSLKDAIRTNEPIMCDPFRTVEVRLAMPASMIASLAKRAMQLEITLPEAYSLAIERFLQAKE